MFSLKILNGNYPNVNCYFGMTLTLYQHGNRTHAQRRASTSSRLRRDRLFSPSTGLMIVTRLGRSEHSVQELPLLSTSDLIVPVPTGSMTNGKGLVSFSESTLANTLDVVWLTQSPDSLEEDDVMIYHRRQRMSDMLDVEYKRQHGALPFNSSSAPATS